MQSKGTRPGHRGLSKVRDVDLCSLHWHHFIVSRCDFKRRTGCAPCACSPGSKQSQLGFPTPDGAAISALVDTLVYLCVILHGYLATALINKLVRHFFCCFDIRQPGRSIGIDEYSSEIEGEHPACCVSCSPRRLFKQLIPFLHTQPWLLAPAHGKG